MPRDSHRWSADDIIREYPQLGIPHFQRGLVWGEESVSLLLESLYFETPCGELVLWQPRHPMKEGIPLKASAVPLYLIIDGQQRLTTLTLFLIFLQHQLEEADHQGPRWA